MFSVTIRCTRRSGGGSFTYDRIIAKNGDEARQAALRLHVGMGRPAGWVERCSA